MKELSNLLGFRESIKVVDATLRDGGLVNDFYFTDDFVKALYQANIDAGVDYMEMGYRASKKVFDESKFGKWKFCADEHIREIVGENDTDLKIAIMADIGRHDKNDFDLFNNYRYSERVYRSDYSSDEDFKENSFKQPLLWS